MRDCGLWRFAPPALLFALLVTSAQWAGAQTQPAVAPPPAAVAPQPAPVAAPPPVVPPPAYPQGYYPPPMAYPPPPGYAYAYPTLPRRPPESVPYEGGPVPSGYHVEERPRKGMLIAGPVALGVPYLLGLTVASSENFPNSTGWLAVPALGPWITLAARHRSNSCASDGLDSCSDAFDSGLDSTTRTFLILDGLAQTTGAILFIYGVASPKRVLARDFLGSLQFAPSRIGRAGYGGLVMGRF